MFHIPVAPNFHQFTGLTQERTFFSLAENSNSELRRYFDIFKREASRFSNPVFRNSGGWSRDQRVFYNFRGSSGIRERAPHTCPGSLASCDHTYEARRISITDPGTHLLIDEPLLPESPTPRRHSSEAIFTILINVNLLFFSSRFPFSRFHLRPVPATTSARCQRQSSAQKPA